MTSANCMKCIQQSIS